MTPRATRTMNRRLSQPPSLRKEGILLTDTIIIDPAPRIRTMKRTPATTGTPVTPPKCFAGSSGGTLLLSIPIIVWAPMIQHWFGYQALGGPGTSRWISATFGTLVFTYGYGD